MQGNKFDCIIIGSGLGGLVCATILAKEGYRVCVLEKNNQFGGNLQTFVRDKNIFDTGIHYIGGLAKGQNLHSYFQYLGIMNDLKLQRLDHDKYDVVSFEGDPTEYPHAQGTQNFIDQLLQYFPDEKQALETYCRKLKEICRKFPFYNLEKGVPYFGNSELLSLKTTDFIASITQDEKLRAVLAGSNLLYAGIPDKTPLYVHALSVNSYMESAWKCVNGGSQISKLLVKRIREKGGKVLKYKEVRSFEIENKILKSVVTKNGERICADRFISNIEPKLTMDLIGKENIRKAYYNRVKSQESVISSFSVYVVFKPKTFKYVNHNIYHSSDLEKVWKSQEYQEKSWPESIMISMVQDRKNPEYAKNLTSICYMRYEEVKAWEHTFNTVAEEKERGEAYGKFKNRKAEAYLNRLEEKFPNIRECIQSIHTSTPLSYRDYIGSHQGSMYGYVKDAEQPMRSFLSPKTRIENLLLTGQSLNMHGVLGVTISAIVTCGEIVGADYLIDKINEEISEQV